MIGAIGTCLLMSVVVVVRVVEAVVKGEAGVCVSVM